MPYQAEISRANPTAFLILIDQSGSMEDPFGAGEPNSRKADGAADAVNRILQNLVLKCAKSEGVRDYFSVGVIGYGQRVGSAFAGALAGQELVPISAIAEQPARVEERQVKVPDGAGGLVEQTARFPVWLEPSCQGGTPMVQALNLAREIVARWCADHPASYPPTVINVTDGESTDGDPTPAAEALRVLSTQDGNVLLYNCHLSDVRAAPILFPDQEEGLPNNFARLLFRMSSVLPEAVRVAAEQERYRVSASSRGFAFNADLRDLISFLDIGTRAANLR